MQRILLTGATGFLGSYILEALIQQGSQVTVLKRSTSDIWRISHLLNDDIQLFDIDKEPLDKAFKDNDIDIVIHTACNYGRSGQSFPEVVDTNLLFGLKLLNRAILSGVSTFINTDTLLPKNINAYSLSKKQFSEWLKQQSDFIQVINLKLEHMYGPRDDRKKFMPWLLDQMEQNVERIPLTEGKQLRDFIYIDDVVLAYLLVLKNREQLSQFAELDVGTGQLMPVKDFVYEIWSAYKKLHPNSKSFLGFGDIPLREGEMVNLTVDNTQLRKLGWDVQVTREEGIFNCLR
jgi:nucleoside-diphosphate-sugar epimerase